MGSSGGKEEKAEAPPRPPGLGEEWGETRRNAVGCTMERYSQFSP